MARNQGDLTDWLKAKLMLAPISSDPGALSFYGPSWWQAIHH
jgi:hypothetical protein